MLSRQVRQENRVVASPKDVGVPVTTENEMWVISQNFFFR